jgi:hypothetical protein
VSGQQKGHHSHETTDAFAEGWDARQYALPNEVVVNPYRAEIVELSKQGTKRSKRQIAARERDVELWDQGWNECDQEMADLKANSSKS